MNHHVDRRTGIRATSHVGIHATRRSAKRVIVCLAGTLVVLLGSAGAASGDFDDAQAQYEIQHFADALTLYERAAESGNCRAQEIAGLMHLHGPRLYGPAVPADAARARHWLSRAAGQGSPVACTLLAGAGAVGGAQRQVGMRADASREGAHDPFVCR